MAATQPLKKRNQRRSWRLSRPHTAPDEARYRESSLRFATRDGRLFTAFQMGGRQYKATS